MKRSYQICLGLWNGSKSAEEILLSKRGLRLFIKKISHPDFFESSIVPHLCNNSLGEGVLEWISSSRIDVDFSSDTDIDSNMDLELQSSRN